MLPVFIIFASAVILSILALLMPIRIHARGAGGTNGDFYAEGSIHLLNGFIGLMFSFIGREQTISPCVFGKKIFTVSVAPVTGRMSGRRKNKKYQTPEAEAVATEKEPVFDRLKHAMKNGREYLGYAKKVMAAVKEIIRFDLVIANITLGLGNPAMTGMATGFIYALNEFLPSTCIITPSFDFTREILRGDFRIRLKIHMTALWKNVYRYGPAAVNAYFKRKKQQNEPLIEEA